MENDDDENKDSVNELNSQYGKTIRVFNSFEEAELYEIKEIRNQKPTERVRDTVKLIIRIYNNSKKIEQLNTFQKIVIDKE